MHEEGDHATKNQLSGSLLQGDGLEKRLEQWECILHDQHGRLLLQGLANGPLHHHLAQIRRKEEAPPLSPHTSKKRNFKRSHLGLAWPPTGAGRRQEGLQDSPLLACQITGVWLRVHTLSTFETPPFGTDSQRAPSL